MTKKLNSRRSTALICATVLACSTFAVAAHAALSAIGNSEVQFRAIGPGGLQIDGNGTGIEVSENGGIVEIQAPLTDLKTGISLRDKHLKDAIKADAHPKAKLAVSRGDLKFPEDNKSVEGSAQGKFTLNGTTKPLTFSYKAERTGSDYHIQGLATVDITQFNLEKPCYLGVCVDKDVKIKVKFKVRDK